MNPASTGWKKLLRRSGGFAPISRNDKENEPRGLSGRKVVVLLSIVVLFVWGQIFFLQFLVSDGFNHASSSRALHNLYAEDNAENQRALEAEAGIKVSDTEIHGVSVGNLVNRTTDDELTRYHPADREFESYRPLLDHLNEQIVSGGRTDGDWDKISNAVVIAIKTGREVYEKRLEWVNKTWLAGRKHAQI